MVEKNLKLMINYVYIYIPMMSISRLHLHVGTYFIVLKAYIKFLIAFKLLSPNSL